MTFETNVLETVGALGQLQESTPVTLELPGTGASDDLANYNPNATAGRDGRTVKQYARAASGEQRPVVLFFYCRVVIPGGKMCQCELMRRMAFSDPRTRPHAGNYRWLEYDVDDPRNADLMRQYGVQTSPTLVFCDAMGGEIRRTVGAIQAGELTGCLTAALDRNTPSLEQHDRRIEQINAQLVSAWQALGSGDAKTAVREFRRLQQQSNRFGYDEYRTEAEAGLSACREVGIGRAQRIAASGAETAERDLIAMRSEFSGIDEVQDAVARALDALRAD